MEMTELIKYLPFLIPIGIAEIVLCITALVHVIRHPNYRFGNKIFWVVVVLLLEIVGPVLYFAIGRGEE